MDASDHSSDLLELAVVTAQSLPVAGWGGILIDLLTGTWMAASFSLASATTPTTPTAATSALAARWAFTGHVTDDAAVVAAVQADSISPALLPDS